MRYLILLILVSGCGKDVINQPKVVPIPALSPTAASCDCPEGTIPKEYWGVVSCQTIATPISYISCPN